MRTLIVMLFSISLAYGQENYSEFKNLPAQCQDVWSKTSQIALSLPLQAGDALAMSIVYSLKIMQLQIEAADYLRANKELYGEYAKMTLMKTNLDQIKADAKRELTDFMTRSDSLIVQLKGMDAKLAKTIYKDISSEREKEIVRQNNRIFYATQEWNKHSASYYSAVDGWGFYEDYLDRIDVIAVSLRKSIDNLVLLNQNARPIMESLVKYIDHKWRHEDIQDLCTKMEQDLEQVATVIH